MTVAVTKGTEYIGARLKDMGYHVVEYGRYKNRIDAVVYTGAQLSETSPVSTNFSGGDGILMINAQNKSIQQIDEYLKRKVYSGLLD